MRKLIKFTTVALATVLFAPIAVATLSQAAAIFV
jgi:hypothetical protein